MILYLDAAMQTFMTGLFPTPAYRVAWCPPKYAEKGLTYLAADGSQSRRGLPGLSLWRQACVPDPDRQTMNMKQIGWNQGVVPTGQTNAGQTVMTPFVAVTAVYEIRGVAESLSDLTTMERQLRFADVYKALNIEVQGVDTFKIPIRVTDLTYENDYQFQEDTGKMILCSFVATIEADGFFLHSYNVKPINNILVTFQDPSCDNGSIETMTISQSDCDPPTPNVVIETTP